MNNSLLLTCLMIVVAAFCTPQLHAQDLVTDRPDQTESSLVVPLGRIQIESGLVHERGGGSGDLDETTNTSVGMLVRFGLIEILELRLAAAYSRVGSYTPCFTPDCPDGRAEYSASGLHDIALGAKIGLADGEGSLPEIALLAHLALPIGDSLLRPSRLLPDFRFSVSHSLSEQFSFGYNLGAELDDQSDRPVAIYTAALGADLFNTVGAYVEFFGGFMAGRAPEHSFDGGITWSPRENLQFDLSAGVGLQPSALGTYIGAGVSCRFPN